MIILRNKNKLTWKYSSPISDNKISEVEREYGWKYPKELREDLKVGNGGRPSLNIFHPTKKIFGQDELEVKTLLSLNKNDVENVHTAAKAISSENKDYRMLIPFMNTSGGNLYCIGPDDTVFYWDHETDKIERIAFSYKNFRDNLTKIDSDSDPIYDQDGVMLRYNGNKIDDVREVLSTKDIKILDKIMKSYKEDYFNSEKDFLSRKGLNKQHVLRNLEIFEIDIWSTKKGFVYTIDCELKRIPGIITGEYDNLGNNDSKWNLND